MTGKALAVFWRDVEHPSLATYRDQVTSRLARAGWSIRQIREGDSIPANAAFLWDPGLGMRLLPDMVMHARIPLVLSVLGLRSFRFSPGRMFGTTSEMDAEQRLVDTLRVQWRNVFSRLRAVVTISEFCREDIENGLGLPAGLITAIPLAADADVFHPAGPAYESSRPYFLHVSHGSMVRKNISRILDAYASMPCPQRPDLVLKLSAPGSLAGLPPGARIMPGELSAARLAELYRGACALVFPSLYEGFGLPLVEAMQCGCPVITSAKTACEEVAGDAGLLVDPWSSASIAEAMIRLAEDASLRQQLIDRGRMRARLFSWDRTAQAHDRLFSGLAIPGCAG